MAKKRSIVKCLVNEFGEKALSNVLNFGTDVNVYSPQIAINWAIGGHEGKLFFIINEYLAYALEAHYFPPVDELMIADMFKATMPAQNIQLRVDSLSKMESQEERRSYVEQLEKFSGKSWRTKIDDPFKYEIFLKYQIQQDIGLDISGRFSPFDVAHYYFQSHHLLLSPELVNELKNIGLDIDLALTQLNDLYPYVRQEASF